MTLLRGFAFLLLLSPAFPAEGPPAPSLDDRLAAVKKLVKDAKWQPALAGLRAVFEEFKDSPEVRRRLPTIEEDMKLCTFHAQEKPPTPEQIFGPGTKSWTEGTRMLVMEFPKGPVSPPWEGTPPDTAILRIGFEDVALDYEGSLAERISVSLSFNFETDNGYDLRSGSNAGPRREQASIARMEPDKSRKRAVGMASADVDAGPGAHKVRFALKGGELSVQIDGRVLVSAKDTKFPRGQLGIFGFRGGSVVVRGKVDPAGMPALLKACSERRFKEWAEKSWKREESIPEWARREEK